ncbi:FtsX-like permease family protein [Aerococcus urinae]|uniref:FtsX-like permease family protein n=2 Tax=Aerococcus mictus TaxID=2976810 RepID=A0A1E9PFP4_9LACT|nr:MULTISPECIES: FtsX-like permease family protein [Aerococcus]KAA9292164.1 ABC transporter permease [Aerococcus mictus]MCY3033539.1 FtsX-like permease family protein [Aerococcus mictus]MCY3062828.1 FtsX-like permease family protein [Aerococcus mictus]MCY3066937.1 FtsX-like permease family protein [Aerococcus mictus]MCY3069030.1 FtsX-like permease family protein [Aerococcus mictus]
MSQRLLWQLAKRNLKVSKMIILPFLLVNALLFALQYVMISLIGNQFVLERNPYFPTVMAFAAVISFFLALAFILYANNFIQKRRSKEFALYSVLGMEKRHIKSLLARESLLQLGFILPLSLIGGHLIGTFAFMAVNKVMRQSGMTLMDYPLKWEVALITVLEIILVHALVYLLNRHRIQKNNPLELMQSGQAGEKVPKGNIFVALVGLALVGTGYYISLTTTNIMQVIYQLLLAIVLVVLGTYCLYNSLSIMFLNWQKQRKSYYYQPKHFLTVSGMLYRMKANAWSLASIAVLSTGVMLVLGLTVSTQRGIESLIDRYQARDYKIELRGPVVEESLDQQLERLETAVDELSQFAPLEEVNYQLSFGQLAVSEVKDNSLVLQAFTPRDQVTQGVVFFGESLEGYNQNYASQESLAEDQVLMATSQDQMEKVDQVTVGDKTYQVKHMPKDRLPVVAGLDALMLVFPSQEALTQAYQAANTSQDIGYLKSPLSYNATFDARENKDVIDQHLDDYEGKGIEISSKTVFRELFYQLNGGFISIGAIVSLVLLIGCFLMLYYKQLSEGQEDMKNYRIMRQIGLPKSLIKSTIRQQIFWVFVLPLLTAVIHMGFAYPILRQGLGLIAIKDRMLILSSFFAVIVCFSLVYYLMYVLTSKAYYRMVTADQ